MMMGYARVSRADQQGTKAQVDALLAAWADRIFEDHSSGGRWERPQLHQMIDFLRDEDVVVVWKIDPLSRSLKDPLTIMDLIEGKEAGSAPSHRQSTKQHLPVGCSCKCLATLLSSSVR